MASKKKDLELIFNLQWKNRTNSSQDEKSNMVGMYDIPATTLNWESFKSYLLKHSGLNEVDLKISYVDFENKEIPIESQQQFQVALYVFRQRARSGEIITLKLDPLNDKRMNRGKTWPVQTITASSPLPPEEPPEWFLKYMKQFKTEVIDEVTTSMSKLVSKNNSSASVPCHHSRKSKSEPSYKRNRKLPLLITDGTEKETIKSFSTLEKKLDHKLEKLEHKTLKLKLKKVALARSSDSDAGRSSSKSRPIGMPLTDSDTMMDAVTASKNDITVPHMNGGESYLQEWEVVNTGKLPWTYETELRYAWGSQAFSPEQKRVKCPLLTPGEKGVVSVLMNVPEPPGDYECYWHFYHNGRRFGHWLGCQVVVDGPKKVTPLIANPTIMGIAGVQKIQDIPLLTKKIKIEEPLDLCTETFQKKADNLFSYEPLKPAEIVMDANTFYNENIDNIIEKTMKMNILPDLSDNHSIVSIADSQSSLSSETANDFVMVDKENKVEVKKEEDVNQDHSTGSDIEIINDVQICGINDDFNANFYPDLIMGDEASAPLDFKLEDLFPQFEVPKDNLACEDLPDLLDNDNHLENACAAAVPCEAPVDLSTKNENEKSFEENDKDSEGTGYAYVVYEGKKIPMPKKYLSANYLATAEDAPTPSTAEEIQQASTQKDEIDENGFQIIDDQKPIAVDDMVASSHCSAVASSFSEAVEPLRNDMTESTGSPNNRLFVFPQSCPGFEVLYPQFEPQARTIESIDLTQDLDNMGHCKSPSENSSWSTCSNAQKERMCQLSHHAGCGNHQGDMCCSRMAYSACPQPQRQHLNCAHSHEKWNESPCSYCYNSVMRHNMNQQSCINSCNPHSPYTVYCSQEPEPLKTPNKESSPNNSKASSTADNNGTVQILPETVVTGAANLASSALNTAKNVFNMFVPPKTHEGSGRWENGHWISTNPDTPREAALTRLEEMGFMNRDLNATLLARYNDDISRVISDLIQ